MTDLPDYIRSRIIHYRRAANLAGYLGLQAAMPMPDGSFAPHYTLHVENWIAGATEQTSPPFMVGASSMVNDIFDKEDASQVSAATAQQIGLITRFVKADYIYDLILASVALEDASASVGGYVAVVMDPFLYFFALLLAPVHKHGFNAVFFGNLRLDREQHPARFLVVVDFILRRVVQLLHPSRPYSDPVAVGTFGKLASLAIAVLDVLRQEDVQVSPMAPGSLCSPTSGRRLELGGDEMATLARIATLARASDVASRRDGIAAPDDVLDPNPNSSSFAYSAAVALQMLLLTPGPDARPLDLQAGYRFAALLHALVPWRTCSGWSGDRPCIIRQDSSRGGICKGCSYVYYCSRAHQQAHWGKYSHGHRTWCDNGMGEV